MTTPSKVRWDSLANGSVATIDMTNFYIKCDNTTSCRLSDGVISATTDPGQMVFYLPSAKLDLG